MPQDLDRETVRLWSVHKTVNQLVHDRGYIVSQPNLDLTLQSFASSYAPSGTVLDRSVLNFQVDHKDSQQDKLYVFFPEDMSVGVKPIRTFLEKMNENNVFKCIVIYRSSLTPSATKVMASLAPKYIMEQFSESELVVNITEHKLVPQHIVLSDEEKKALLARYRLKDTQLPRILISDPVARYYGLHRGEVVKILRPSETAGRYVTYRIAI
jgi:DNA-directed RNA polymerases I, II, and III subunit RPABC1